MTNWLDNADIQGRIPELETPSSLAADAAARLREAHSQPRNGNNKQDMIQQLLKPSSGESGSGGGLLDGIL